MFSSLVGNIITYIGNNGFYSCTGQQAGDIRVTAYKIMRVGVTEFIQASPFFKFNAPVFRIY